MADFSSGVRLIGAGSQWVSATNARPTIAATAMYARAPVAGPPATRFRVAASVTAGMSGSAYCGSFDWFSERNRSGTSTQHARSRGSRAASSNRAFQVSRQCFTRASAGTIQGKAATGTIGR